MSGRRGWVVVTGASRGIGAAVATALAADGFDTVLWARSTDELTRTAHDVEAAGGQARVQAVDVGQGDQVEAAAAHCLNGIELLAGVVLNAGVGRWAPLSELPPAEWHRTLRTNLDGAYHVLRTTVPQLTRQRRGLVVGMLSDSAVHPHAGRAAYSASKAAMSALLETTRREVRPFGVRVSSILPSGVDTHFQGSYDQAGPGTRNGALTCAEVAHAVVTLFGFPAHVEIRTLQMAAMTATYGPFPERVES